MIGEQATTTHPPTFERIIGEYGDTHGGRLLLVIAGLHGNEKGGIIAAERVLERLHADKPAIDGRLVVIAGNLSALEAGERYVDADLNRMWTPERVEVDVDATVTESVEQQELLAAIDEQSQGDWDTITLVDLHSTSADAMPFCIISDTLHNRSFAFDLEMPVILGLEEAIAGTIQEYFGERGFVTTAVEGGQHDAPETADRLESVMWLSLAAAQLMRRRDIPDYGRHLAHLGDLTHALPRVVEVRHRHGRVVGDGFEMVPGFENFSPVGEGEVVANDNTGPVRAIERGMLLLPSYQGLGDDGFFLGRRVKRMWLRVSSVVRKMHMEVFLPLLPGVRRDPTDARTILVDPKVARYIVLKIFHLFGYRKCPPQDGMLVFRRRPERWLV